ncbi:MAG: hypothetical protein RIS80_43 [Actinomycetota bacterium]
MEPQEIKLSDFAPKMIAAIDAIKSSYGSFSTHPSLKADPNKVEAVLSELTNRLEDNFPFFHPHYAGQMLKPPHPVAMAAYLATMMLNPNNHSIDGGRATTMLEREVLRDMAQRIFWDTWPGAAPLQILKRYGFLERLTQTWLWPTAKTPTTR